MMFSSAARTLLGIEEIGLPNVGILLDFGHSLFGGESPADAAQLAIDRGRLFAIEVNDNWRDWDDDMVVGSVHLHRDLRVLLRAARDRLGGRRLLDQFPFREDPVEAARAASAIMRAIDRALDLIDRDALAAAQQAQDALRAQRIVRRALLERASADASDAAPCCPARSRAESRTATASRSRGSGGRPQPTETAELRRRGRPTCGATSSA